MADSTIVRSYAEAKAAGLKRYFTGKPCPKGHVAERFTANNACVECNAARYREWAAKNGDKILHYREENAEHRAAVLKAWTEKNREKLKAQRRAKYLRTIERKMLLERIYRKVNRDRLLAKGRLDRAANRDLYRTYYRRRRARKKAAAGEHSPEDIAAIRAAQKNRCAYCRKKLPKNGGEIDHITPLFRGGSNDRRNLQLLCSSCNRSKGARDPLDHARRIGLLV
jgi:5-methylcytosine-specific restriction endonuclease McrA